MPTNAAVMRKLTLRGLRAHPTRFVAMMLAVIVATTFLGGAIVLRDSVVRTIERNTTEALKGVDAAIEPDLNLAEDNFNDNPTVPAELFDAVTSTPGVAAAAGVLQGQLVLLQPLPEGQVARTTGIGTLRIDAEALNPYQLVDGRWPERSGEVALDAKTAQVKKLPVGSDVQLATSVGQVGATVVGTVRYGSLPNENDQLNVIVSAADAFDWLGAGQAAYQFTYVSAAAGVETGSLVDALRRAVGDEARTPKKAETTIGPPVAPTDRYDVLSGDEFRRQQAGEAGNLTSWVGTGMQVFAYVALFVGIFIIYNTFTIVVAQRTRELALLRAIGASGKQVRRSVLFESLIVGIVASATGYLIGVGLVALLARTVPDLISFGTSGDVGLTVAPIGVLQTLLSGTLVTVISAFIPAFRAARVRPLEALRVASTDRSSSSQIRAWLGLALTATGAVVLIVASVTETAILLLPAPALLLLGVLLLGPWLSKRVAELARAVLRIGGGTPVRLAVDNVERNPRRAATTANALVIGVTMVVFVTAAGGALRDFAVQFISRFGGPDLILASSTPTFPSGVAEKLNGLEGVSRVVPVYQGVGRTVLETTQGGRGEPIPLPIAALDLADDASALGIEATSGSLQGLGDSQVAVADFFGQLGIGLGSPVTVTFANGETRSYTVGALTKFSLSVPPVLMNTSSLKQVVPDAMPATYNLQVRSGQLETVKKALDELTTTYSSIQVVPGNAIASFVKAFFDTLISAINALLVIAVVIAVFGIVNTLMLSIIERTREIGLLRAVGMSRRQVRTSIRTESLIVALLGTGIGVAFGLFLAYFVTRPLFTDPDAGITGGFRWPLEELAVIDSLGVLIGLVASIIPAWRAARLDILEAIRTE
ncbi:MAG: ABC transporter permease [Acidimicrobiales bacterium]|nr:ABC transporter permease [Acidimicrobiales bacterium]